MLRALSAETGETVLAEFAESRFVLQRGSALRGESARRVARIAASYPAVSVRFRSGNNEADGRNADSIARLGSQSGSDVDLSCAGPGAEKILRELVSVLNPPLGRERHESE